MKTIIDTLRKLVDLLPDVKCSDGDYIIDHTKHEDLVNECLTLGYDPLMLTVEPVAVLSTSHLPEAEVATLDDRIEDEEGVIGLVRDSGFMLYTDQNLTNAPYARVILERAKGQGICWVMFDADGAIHPDFQTFNW